MRPLCAGARAQAWQRASSGTHDRAAAAPEAPTTQHPAAHPTGAAPCDASSSAHAPHLPATGDAAALSPGRAATMHDRHSGTQLRNNGNGIGHVHDSEHRCPPRAQRSSVAACHAVDAQSNAAGAAVVVSTAAVHVSTKRHHCGEVMGEYILYRF